jgi:predicted transposase/invertase (TIGR01784 family)
VHHAFRLADRDSGRVLEETLEIHTLELGWYNLTEDELGTASVLDLWLFWLLHAHEYDTETLDRLFPLPAFRQATETITRIAKITEDKTMYDTREKAIRDRQWAFNAVREEGREEGLEQGREEGLEQGREEGEIKLIQTLQEVLGLPVSNSANFEGQSLADLRKLTAELRSKIQRRS